MQVRHWLSDEIRYSELRFSSINLRLLSWGDVKSVSQSCCDISPRLSLLPFTSIEIISTVIHSMNNSFFMCSKIRYRVTAVTSTYLLTMCRKFCIQNIFQIKITSYSVEKLIWNVNFIQKKSNENFKKSLFVSIERKNKHYFYNSDLYFLRHCHIGWVRVTGVVQAPFSHPPVSKKGASEKHSQMRGRAAVHTRVKINDSIVFFRRFAARTAKITPPGS